MMTQHQLQLLLHHFKLIRSIEVINGGNDGDYLPTPTNDNIK